jgi:hypothetical protein
MDLVTRDADTVFAELICADAQWLREEFDALISASFGQPPAAPPPAPPRVPPPRGHTSPGRQHLPWHHFPAVPYRVAGPEHRRQRAPPG